MRQQISRFRLGRFWDAVASGVVAWRYVILLGWIAVAVLATVFLPGISSSGAIGNLVPKKSAALAAELDATRLFGLPLTSGVEVVQRDPHSFPLAVQKHAAQVATDVDQGRVHGIYGLAGALPVANTAGLFPGSRERSTTIVTFLYFKPGVSLGAQSRGAQQFVRRYLSAPQDHVVGVTGVAVARDAQGKIIVAHLPQVELATLLAIAVIVGLQFRSVGAPLAVLVCAGVAYLVDIRVVAWAGQLAGITVPPDLEPVLLVLLLGVTTDYSVFFLAGMRGRLHGGDARLPAARRATAEYLPIIVTAGLIVAAGSASLGVARLAVVRALGPGLALTVLIAMVVAVTLTPALIAIFGRLLFLPGRAPRPAGNWRERIAKAAARPGAGHPDRLRLRGRPADPDGGRVRHAPGAAPDPVIAGQFGGRPRPGRRVAGLRARDTGSHRDSRDRAGRGREAGRAGAAGARGDRPARRGFRRWA